MGQRNINEIMSEGRKLTLEHAELIRKGIHGTLTPDEVTRKAQLEGYLLGLMGEAQAQGVGVEAEDEVSNSDEDEDWYGDEEQGNLFEDEDENPDEVNDSPAGFRHW